MRSEAAAAYSFDRFVLDLDRGALLADGAECALRPKSLMLLRVFVENPDRVIHRDEIMEAVWPGVFVSDDSIAQCVSDIRRALGDNEQHADSAASRVFVLSSGGAQNAAADIRRAASNP